MLKTARNVLHPCGKRAAGDTIAAFVWWLVRPFPASVEGGRRLRLERITRLCINVSSALVFSFGGPHRGFVWIFFFDPFNTGGSSYPFDREE